MKSFIALTLMLIIACLFVGSVSADHVYYIGDPITLSGTNPETYTVYLYISGPNMPIQEIPVAGGGYLTTADKPLGVNLDRTWKTTFNLANNFDASTYKIYISVEPLKYSDKGQPYVKFDDNIVQKTTNLILQGITSSSFGSGLKITETPTQTITVQETALSTETQKAQPTATPFPVFAAVFGAVVLLGFMRK
ncbi:MAG: hypothetical protein Q4Q53_04280 [Methanocorpusculum sp.]|nr:hypothetical protein [Methanocorpusculum sp.]